MRKPKDVPYWAFKGDARAWRRSKRAEWRAIKRAVGQFRMGCAYTPVEPQVCGLERILTDGDLYLSPKVWGR